MTFIYKLQLNAHYKVASHWDENTNRILEDHFIYLKSLHDQGVAAFVGRTDYPVDHADLFGICVLNADNEEEANNLMKSDPAVLNHVMEAQIHPFLIIF